MSTMENVLFNIADHPTPKISEGGVAFCMRAQNFDLYVATTYRKTSHAKSKEDGQGWEETEVSDTLNVFDNSEGRTPTLARVYDWHRCDTRMTELGEICNTASASWGGGGNNMPYVLNDQGGSQMSVSEDKTATLRSEEHGHQPCVTESAVVRRLTPLECERLQGYPDGWTDIGEWTDSKGKKHKDADSPKYKALGNSIALPFWEWMAKRMVKHLDTESPTMASLFDGIGGFPLVFQRAGVKAIWASEIEEFPIAVTKKHFPENEE